VVVTEMGRVQALVRRPGMEHWTGSDSARVNQLVLVNNSKRPLVLLAGEIVTGGKQDRIIAKDRIVPPESDPIDLGVFCVEPGRWTATSAKFGGLGATIAQPSVRRIAMAAKDQSKVWSSVRSTQEAMAVEVGRGMSGGVAASPAAAELNSTTSYARVMSNTAVRDKLEGVAAPLQRDYEGVMRELRDRNAVGLVVAVNGSIIWADVFESNALLQKYWPKLVRSYAAEALVQRASLGKADETEAQRFLTNLNGRHETVDSEPGVYRHTEIAGDGFRAFELTSLLPKTGFDLHVAKMAE